MTTPRMPSLFHLSWPIFIDLGMHFATIMINTAMVGMISVDAVAELTVGNQVFDLGFILFNFINIGVAVVTAQSLGNGNLRMVRRVIHMGLGLNLIWGVIVAIAVFASAGFIVEVMNVPPEIADSSRNYMRIISLCFIPESLCLCCGQVLRGYGRTRDPMYISMLMNLITMFLNAVFLFGLFHVPKMGVEGVALSTLIGRLICVGIIYKLMLKRTRIRVIHRFLFVIKLKILRQILSVGLPGAGENLSWHRSLILRRHRAGYPWHLLSDGDADDHLVYLHRNRNRDPGCPLRGSHETKACLQTAFAFREDRLSDNSGNRRDCASVYRQTFLLVFYRQ